jgi:hypothetical protein
MKTMEELNRNEKNILETFQKMEDELEKVKLEN